MGAVGVAALRVHLRPVKVMTGSQLQLLLLESHSNCHKLGLTAVSEGKWVRGDFSNLPTEGFSGRNFPWQVVRCVCVLQVVRQTHKDMHPEKLWVTYL